MSEQKQWPILLVAPRCPKCCSTILLNQRGDVWCTFIGGGKDPSCDYRGTVKLEEKK